MSAYPPKVFALKAAMSMPYWRWKRRLVMQKTATIVALALGCALTGCTVGPKYHAPVTQAPPAFTAPPAPPEGNGQWTIAQPQDTAIRGNWWELFNDQELNSLEDQLNVNNQSIKVAFENYMEARALVGEARALYFPTLTANPAYTRSRSSGNLTNAATTTGSGGVTANGGRQSSVYSLPATISWQPDLWGKVRNEVHAAEYTAQMDAADLANEKLSEQADLAEYFFELRGQDALEKLYNDTVAADQKALDLAQASYDAGIGDYITVEEAKSTLQSAQSAAINLGVLRSQYEHAIAVLVGKPAPASRYRTGPSMLLHQPFPSECLHNFWSGARISPPRNESWPRIMPRSASLTPRSIPT